MALYKYHYITLDTKRTPRISLQNIVAGETGNMLVITLTNNESTVNLAEKSNGEFIYRICLRVDSNLGVRRQDSATENSGIAFIEENTVDHGKVNILLSKDSFTAGKNRARLEIYSTRSEENDTLIVSAEWTFDVDGADEGNNVGVAIPLLVHYEKLAESWARGGTGVRDGENIDNAMYYKDLAEQAVQGGIIDPTFATWLTAHMSDFITAIGNDADEWLSEHITNPSNPPLDTSLSLSNAAAPANLLGYIVNYLGASVYRSQKNTAASTYNATIAYNGNIAAVTSENAHLSIYPVEANKLYVLYGLQVRVVATTYGNALAVFNTALFDGETTLTENTIVVPKDTSGVATDYNVTFRPTADGYVYIYSYGNYNALELYDGVYRSTALDNISVSTKPSESYDVSFADIFDKYESTFIDDFTTRESFVDTDHPYTILGSDADAPTITTGTGATRTGASGMATLAYSRTFNSFPYVCLIGRVAGASQYVKVFDDSNNVIAGAISIGASGNVSHSGQVYGKIHVNAAYVVLFVNSDSVTVYDDSGVEVRIPVSYTSDKPMNIALGFGADASLYGYGSFVEFVKRPMQTLDFNRCVAENEDASSLSAVRDVIRFTHAVWNGGAVASFYSKPSDNPYMEIVSGLSNNPCIKCICDYAVDNGYRTEIGITPIKGSLKGKLGGLQRFRVSADYFMASADNPGVNDFYTYIFQLHDANFAVQGWNDGPPLDLRVYNGKLSAYVCYIDNGAVPQGDNVHTVDSYDLCDWTMDAWHHIEVEARIGWRNVLAPRLVIRVDGIERLNIETPLGYNIVSSGGYVNTHFGNYVPQWHDASYPTTHSEVIVTNIRWEGTQNVN